MSLFDKMSWKQALLKGALLVLASYSIAVYLNVATSIWRLIELLPASVVSGAATFLLYFSAPFQPEGVHEQEVFLELLLVWLLSAPASVPLMVAAYIAVSRSRQLISRRKDESTGHLKT